MVIELGWPVGYCIGTVRHDWCAHCRDDFGALAVFQLAEFNVCTGNFGVDSLTWARVGLSLSRLCRRSVSMRCLSLRASLNGIL